MHTPTPAQVSALIEAAAFAAGVLHGAAELLAQTEQYKAATAARKALADLNTASWAALGRPSHP